MRRPAPGARRLGITDVEDEVPDEVGAGRDDVGLDLDGREAVFDENGVDRVAADPAGLDVRPRPVAPDAVGAAVVVVPDPGAPLLERDADPDGAPVAGAGDVPPPDGLTEDGAVGACRCTCSTVTTVIPPTAAAVAAPTTSLVVNVAVATARIIRARRRRHGRGGAARPVVAR